MRAGPDMLGGGCSCGMLRLTFGLTNGIDATEDISFSQVVIDSGAWGPLIPILASLMASPQYQAYFTAQVEHHLAGALATESVQRRLAALGTELRPAIAAEAIRWLPDREPAVMQWRSGKRRCNGSRIRWTPVNSGCAS